MAPSPYLIVLAGGSGTRFWPKSTSRRPKQLLSFSQQSPSTLLARTLERFEGIVAPARQWVVTTRALTAAVEPEARGARILTEPEGRNTAPCIYWAARSVAAEEANALMLVMPADHHVRDVAAFRATLEAAMARARSQAELVTLGVKPSRPETGYGYLETAEGLAGGGLRVRAFIEKPDAERAGQFFRSGQHLWNGGMFIARAGVLLDAFDRHLPEYRQVWERAEGRVADAYPRLTATSIDYGIMEKAQNVVTFRLDCGWDDVGSWSSLEALAKADAPSAPENVVAAGQIVAVQSRGNIVDAPDRLVALLGVDDLIVVEHGGAILVARKDCAQDIRQVVDAVKRVRPDLT